MLNPAINRQSCDSGVIISRNCQWQTINFQTITRADVLIHLTFSPDKHEQALALLDGERKTGNTIERGTLPPEPTRKLLLDLLRATPPHPLADFSGNPFLLRGSTFQRLIWRLLSELGPGVTTTYGELATATGRRGGARAVGQACHANPLALIIPCHRVVGQRNIGGFAGGVRTKMKLLDLEREGDKNGS